MKPEQFAYWLQGIAEISIDSRPTEAQWNIIKDHLSKVFVKETPDRNTELAAESLDEKLQHDLPGTPMSEISKYRSDSQLEQQAFNEIKRTVDAEKARIEKEKEKAANEKMEAVEMIDLETIFKTFRDDKTNPLNPNEERLINRKKLLEAEEKTRAEFNNAVKELKDELLEGFKRSELAKNAELLRSLWKQTFLEEGTPSRPVETKAQKPSKSAAETLIC